MFDWLIIIASSLIVCVWAFNEFKDDMRNLWKSHICDTYPHEDDL